MESAVPDALKCPRTRTRRIENDYVPPYPAWTARGEASLKPVVMAYLGVQSHGPELLGQACAALREITASFALPDAPRHHDLAHFVDAEDFDTMTAIAYWTDAESFRRWSLSPEVAGFWNSEARESGKIGFFQEIFSPMGDAFETLFSASDRLEGVGIALGSYSADPIQEHAYWGSARERLPLAQTDALTPSGQLAQESVRGKRIRLAGHHNVAVIRSGQDWSATAGKERELYSGQMEPIFRAGMDYLRDEGRAIGCYANRYMSVLDADGRQTEKSFGYSIWHSLADMERWAESHPTHIAIFGTFMKIVQELNFQLALRLYHEVSIVQADQQVYEYINCHPKTGLLGAL